ncbi:hypothetical protein FJT64_018735 [Amphibalanus amphitrite]|uniref:DNA helicase Pif1-like 2B domain-containing protein n=1 Tax=Amphibalanus amphitrite TaxID=1232801 RepID=A0A6A4WTS4_AMPAM|nr:hypothetical protein FJT64_018735 [Amphibalanus amphitrite]
MSVYGLEVGGAVGEVATHSPDGAVDAVEATVADAPDDAAARRPAADAPDAEAVGGAVGEEAPHTPDGAVDAVEVAAVDALDGAAARRPAADAPDAEAVGGAVGEEAPHTPDDAVDAVEVAAVDALDGAAARRPAADAPDAEAVGGAVGEEAPHTPDDAVDAVEAAAVDAPDGAAARQPAADAHDAEAVGGADGQAPVDAPARRRGDQHLLARNYVPAEFEPPAGMQLGRMDTVCAHCGALRWRAEPAGACCHQGKVQLDFHPPPPDEMVELMTPGTAFYDEFRGKIRAYNTAFQLASMGCNVVRHDGAYHAAFTVQGSVCHRMGSLLPARGGEEQFMQVYFLDADEATARRATMCGGLDRAVLDILLGMLHEHNNYVRALQPALLMARGVPNCRIVLSAEHRPLSEHERRFNLPIGREVAVLMPNEMGGRRDIVVRERGGQLFRIDELSRQYDPLLYVLLHPRGTDGWSLELKAERGVTIRQYGAFHMRFRPGHFNLIPRGGRLFQQYLVDTEAKAESSRLSYVRANQDGFNGFRAETIRGLITHAMGAIRYCIKYVTKGSDRIMFAVQPDGVVDEVTQYQNSRYLGSMEAAWRLLDRPVHVHHPPVQRLQLHLGDDERRVPHPEVPGVVASETLSRVYTTTPRAGEVFFLRLLLHSVRGPRSYEHLRTVDGRVCATMREACSALGLLEDGAHWARALEEASVTRFAGGLRFLFALILIEGEATCDPMALWMRFADALSEDIARRQRTARAAGRRGLTEDEVRQQALRKIAGILRRLRGRSLAEYGLPVPPVPDAAAAADGDDDEPPGVTYASVDTISDDDNEDHGPPVPTEVLNAIDVSGMPSHRLQVKVGAPVVLMRNLDAPRVVNGTLCTVLRAAPNVLELRIAINQQGRQSSTPAAASSRS